MFDFIESLLQKFTIPSVEYRSSLLPALPITSAMRRSFDKEYLDFISMLFLTAQRLKDMNQENQLWFADEIAKTLRQGYPGLSVQEYEAILQRIIDED